MLQLSPLIFHLPYRSSMVANATPSASFLRFSINGVQRPVWVSASSRDIFAVLSDGCGSGSARLHICDAAEIGFATSFISCFCWAAGDGETRNADGASALGGPSCFCRPSLSDSTSSRTISGLSLADATRG